MGTLLEATRFATKEIQRKADSEKYFYDPIAWSEYMLGVRLWSKQEELSQDIVVEHDIAVKAAHATGKSWWVALMIVWWVDTRYGRKNAIGQTDLYVASTAPSVKQIGAIVWDYVRKFKNAISERYRSGLIDHELPGYITADNEWKEDNGQILGIGRKPPDNLADSSFQGVHRRYVLAIGDEGVGLSLEMIDALGNITNNPDSRRVLICNPTNPASTLGKIFKNNGYGVWKLHTISALDSPNFKPDKEGLPEEMLKDLVDQGYLERKKAEYGENSARFKARVLGEFAWDLGDTLITPEDLAVAHDTEIHPLEADSVKLGVDIGRYGCFDDQTEVLTDRGWMLFESLNGSESVLSVSPNEASAEWMPITQLHKYEYDGLLNYHERLGANFAITDNHNLLAGKAGPERKLGRTWSVERYDSLAQNFLLRNDVGWSGTNPAKMEFCTTVPLPHGGFRAHSYSFDYLDWAEFLGWFISEGNVYHEKSKHGRYRICIAQNPGEKADIIASLLKRMGLKFRYKKNPHGPSGQFEFTSRSIGLWLLEHCNHGAVNKKVPDSLKNASESALQRFLVAFRLGDGTQNSHGSNSYMTSSRQLADDLQEMLAKLGRAGKLSVSGKAGSTSEIFGRTIVRTADQFTVYEKRPTKTRGVYVDKRNVERRHYKGFVYCVSTPHRTILVRRGGVTMWSGNSDRSVIYVNTGGRVRLLKAFDQNSLVQLANEVHNAAIDFGASEVRYDLQGIGQGFEELLFQLEPRPYKMIGLSGSSASPDRRQWYNARAYWWDRVRRQLREGTLDVDPLDENLNDELVMVEYKFAPSGGLLLESKDEMRKRGVKSPDFADAFVYASVDLDDMLNPEPKKQTTYEDAETVMGDDVPNYLGLLVQGW